MSVADVMKKIKSNNIKFVDLRFTDTKGKEQHVTVPVSAFDKTKFTVAAASMCGLISIKITIIYADFEDIISLSPAF